MAERVYEGEIEAGRCYLLVEFGTVSALGHRFRVDPMERVALDTYQPGITISRRLADALQATVRVPPTTNGAPRGGAGVARVCYRVCPNGDPPLWEGEAEARVVDENVQPSFGMAQILNWRVEVDGPGGTFKVTFPPR